MLPQELEKTWDLLDITPRLVPQIQDLALVTIKLSRRWLPHRSVGIAKQAVKLRIEELKITKAMQPYTQKVPRKGNGQNVAPSPFRVVACEADHESAVEA